MKLVSVKVNNGHDEFIVFRFKIPKYTRLMNGEQISAKIEFLDISISSKWTPEYMDNGKPHGTLELL